METFLNLFLMWIVDNETQNRMNLKVLEIVQKTKKMIFCYPIVLLMSLIMTASAIYLVDVNYEKNEHEFLATKILLIAGLGISLMFAIKMLTQRIGNALLWNVLGLLFLVGFYFVLPTNKDDFTDMYVYLLAPVYILAHLLVAFIAFVKKEDSERNFWQFNKNLFVNFFLTLIFTGVLIGGIELAILAVDKLFNVGVLDKTYFRTFLTLLIFGSTFIFLLFNETGLKVLEKDGEYPVVLKFFTQFVLIPLLFIFVVILYLYSIKILINWELPRGWVSYLVLAYSVVGILALLLVHPLKEDTTKSWVRIFSKVFYYTLLPLLVLLFVAIFTRILAYAFTEARYFVLAMALWLSSLVLYFIFSKKPTIKFIPISLFLFGFFSLTLPYFNAFSVAKRSQKNDLERVLADNNLVVDGKIDFNKEVADSVVRELESKFEFLDNRHEREYLFGFLSEEMKKDSPSTNYRHWSLISKFKNVKVTKNIYSESFYTQLTNSQTSYDISNYQYAINQTYLQSQTFPVDEDRIEVKYQADIEFKLILNEKDSVDLMPLVVKLFDNSNEMTENEEVDGLFIESEVGNYSVKVIFQTISRQNNDKEKPYYYLNDALFLLRKN